jgi:hypothetical protein
MGEGPEERGKGKITEMMFERPMSGSLLANWSVASWV